MFSSYLKIQLFLPSYILVIFESLRGKRAINFFYFLLLLYLFFTQINVVTLMKMRSCRTNEKILENFGFHASIDLRWVKGQIVFILMIFYFHMIYKYEKVSLPLISGNSHNLNLGKFPMI